MNFFNKLILSLYLLVKQYPKQYFSLCLLILFVTLFLFIKAKYGQKIFIKRTKRLLSKNYELALKKLLKSDLETISYFFEPENIAMNHYLKIKMFFSQTEQVKKIFREISKDEVQNTKLKAGISILAKLGTPQAVDYLITFLYEKNPYIVAFTIDKLADIKSNKVIISFIEILQTNIDFQILTQLKKSYLKFGTKGADKLTSIIFNLDPNLQIWCLEILENYPEKDYTPIFIKLLNSNNCEVKITAMKSLTKFKEHTNITPIIIKCLEDENWQIRNIAAKILGEMTAVEAAPILAENLNDKNSLVRLETANALINLGYEGIKYLINIAKKPSAPKEVIQALKNQDIVFIIEAFEKILDNKKEQTEETDGPYLKVLSKQ